MPFKATIKNGILHFDKPSEYGAWEAWKQDHNGAAIVISEPKHGVSDNMRGYMFGAIIPFLKRLVPAWEPLESDQIYEVLKKAFNYFEALNPVTGRVERYGQSIMARDVDKEEAAAFLRDLGEWVRENYGRELPSAAKYLKWVASAPLKGETYNEI